VAGIELAVCYYFLLSLAAFFFAAGFFAAFFFVAFLAGAFLAGFLAAFFFVAFVLGAAAAGCAAAAGAAMGLLACSPVPRFSCSPIGDILFSWSELGVDEQR
jgi:hypothetical protein